MRVLIVGNGNSTIGRGLGPTIDSLDGYVVRFPVTNWQTLEDYGWKTDYVCTTVVRRRKILHDERKPALGVWIYPVDRLFGERGKIIEETLLVECKVMVCEDEIRPWLARYLRLQSEMVNGRWMSRSMKEEVTDEHKYKHFSLGTAAVVIVAQKMKGLKEILLLGCDNLWEGTRKDFGRCNFSKTPGTPHNFKVERKLLDMICKRYEVKIRSI
jgi:hypothetical protein